MDHLTGCPGGVTRDSRGQSVTLELAPPPGGSVVQPRSLQARSILAASRATRGAAHGGSRAQGPQGLEVCPSPVGTSRHSRRVSLDANIAVPARECHLIAQAIETIRMGMRMNWDRDESVAIDFDQLFESYESDEHSFDLEENMSTWFSELRKARPSSPESGSPQSSPSSRTSSPTFLPTILEDRARDLPGQPLTE
ncbi:hypothetical protein T484DRAFT_1758026 [Baffinella frigidus]|nr:hypothetical protein T484DRAFT_1758026 [Cryptophyta sp. CCMP2293]